MNELTSIIILTYNGLAHTQACIESIRNHTIPGTYELIVVDNASTDGTVEWLNQDDDIKTILNSENMGFPAGCNQGMKAASGQYLLLLNNDTIVTPRWLDNLLVCANSDSRIGAVGPVTNNASYYSTISVNYQSTEEMQAFADNYNHSNPKRWMNRLKLIGFCLLIRREAYEQVGELNEQFSPGNFEDDDYCLRILNAGFRLVLCGDTFIHHEGSGTFGKDPAAFLQLLQNNAKIFENHWGFNPQYSLNIRYDIMSLINEEADKPLKILEIGCACGATLLEIQNHYTNTEIFGLELNPNAANIAAKFGVITTGNIETFNNDSYDNYFDYIICADVLEHLKDPWDVLSKLKNWIKADGKVLASIPNVAHFSVIRDLIQGHWNYTDRGLLDITHLRFFTVNSIKRLFSSSGYTSAELNQIQLAHSQEDEEWLNEMARIFGDEAKKNWVVYQYLVKARKTVITYNKNESKAYTAFKRAFRRIEWGVTPDESLQEINALIDSGDITMLDFNLFLERDSTKPKEIEQLWKPFIEQRIKKDDKSK
ncbi:bifunctional glycosyltransferase family 2 protein/class I SAM-dependent methyltransferase [Cohnella lupini]|uniref:GT2 family glycosyltransferase n=1 Tax=Cohnella lupini TaxID=1294267 RepID=A0A3D9IVR5_9BACL|nr:bifunctional glycosyltransferase family 2 protein/class I SAM-dependent methyltransferase [Cohnella lupini]RED65943.1 GT2 family glycosyltransferase [Cohnella lupini]